MRRFLPLLLALIFMVSCLPRALGEEITYTGVVTGGSLHLRREPSASGKVITTYKAGTEVEILENDGTWCKVKKGSKTGYMMTQYLTIKANYDHLGWGQSAADGTVLNLREKAAQDSAIVYKCMSGAAFEVVAESGDWYKVRAGSLFGFVEKEKLRLVEGDFALGLSSGEASGALTAASLHSALREVGSMLSISREEGSFPYTVSYPELGIAEADTRLSAWVQASLAAFQQDYDQNHAGAAASCTIEYQSLAIDENYASVLMLAEYRVGTLRAETILTLNVDRKTGRVIAGRDLFQDASRALFCLESGMSDLISVATDGYTGKPQESWLDNALLTREGVMVLMPSGQYLPAALGTRQVLLPYAQIAETMTVTSQLIAGFIRVIDPTKPMIALTFDDGPSEETERILKVLAQYDARATFCILGNKVETYGDTIKRAIAQGNEIASHTWNHKKLTELSASSIRSQLTRTSDAVRELTGGYEIKVLRPPYGSVNKNVRNICAEMGMVIAHWKVDTLDWETRSTTKTYRAIMKGAKNGAIILCHDLYSSTASAVEKAVPELVEKGFQLVTVSELLSFHKDGAQAGTVYAYLDPENIAAP